MLLLVEERVELTVCPADSDEEELPLLEDIVVECLEDPLTKYLRIK